MTKSNFQRGMQVRASMANACRGRRNETFCFDRGWGAPSPMCFSAQESSGLLLSPASHPSHLLIPVFRWPQLPGTTNDVATSHLPGGSEGISGDCQSRIPGSRVMTLAVLRGRLCLCSHQPCKGFWAPPALTLFQLFNFCPSDGSDLGLNLYFDHC